MTRITVPQFAILADNIVVGDVKFTTKMQLKYSLELRNIGINLHVDCTVDDNKLMFAELFCEFNIHPDDWNASISNGELVIKKEDVSFFVAQAVGTVRGVFYCKTEGTPFNHIILPPLNVTDMVKDDFIIKI